MTKTSIRWFILFLVVAGGLFFLLNRDFLPGLSPQSKSDESLRMLEAVMRLIQEDYVDEPDPGRTMTGAFRGLVDSLDVLSSYLDKSSVGRYRDSNPFELMETGLILYKRYPSFPVIIGIKEDSPAARSELRLGDPVYALDGLSTLELSMLEVNLYLKHDEARPVKIKTTQNGRSKTIEVGRSRLHEEPYSFSPAIDTSGVLRVSHFYPPLVQRINTNLVPLLKTAKAPLILDLRNCIEGNLEEAVQFINLFLQSEEIGQLRKKGGRTTPVVCQNPGELESLELCIWINQATIGPAEAVASVLKVQKQAKVIGHQTLGLAAQQRFFPLADGSGLVLTSAVFHPKGSELWQKGITPDFTLDPENQNRNAFMRKTRELLPPL